MKEEFESVTDDPGPGSTYLRPRSFFDFLHIKSFFFRKCTSLDVINHHFTMLNPPTRASFLHA